jgi:hypothetical protein
MNPELLILRVPLSDDEIVQRFSTETALNIPETPKEVEAPPDIPVATPIRVRRLEDVLSSLNRKIGRSRVGFTCIDRLDGIAGQALAKISTQVMAIALGQDYIHVPFDHLDQPSHDGGLTPSKYCEQWEQRLNIGGDSTRKRSSYQHIHNLCQSEPVTEIITHDFKVGHLYCFRECHSFSEVYRDELRDAWKTVINGLRERQPLIADSTAIDQTNVLQVAIHIQSRDTDDYYLTAMKRLEIDYPSIVFDIVSDGIPDDFKDIISQFDSEKIRLHLTPKATKALKDKVQSKPYSRCLTIGGYGVSRNHALLNRRKPVLTQSSAKTVTTATTNGTTIFDAFNILVRADILILSESPFSFLAALYSNGRKLYPAGPTSRQPPKWCEESDYWFDHVSRLF